MAHPALQVVVVVGWGRGRAGRGVTDVEIAGPAAADHDHVDLRTEREALRPVDEAVRFGQDPELSFAPAPVASFICTEYGDCVGLYNSGFDPAHSRLAPGIVLLGHVIRDAIERRVPTFDFLRGDEPYKYAFGPAPTDLMSLRLTP